MGHHRADTRASRSRQQVTPGTPGYPVPAAGKRAARKPERIRPERPAAAAPVQLVERKVEQATAPTRGTSTGRRSAPRRSLFRGLPSAPILLGVAALVISAGGAVSAADQQLVGAQGGTDAPTKIMQASAVSGAAAVGSTSLLEQRGPVVSRGSRRDSPAAGGTDIQAEAEAQAKQRYAALADVDKQADKQSAKIKLNLWHLPVASYHLTARFGDYGLWSGFHTGLDFAAPSGTPIYAIANGVIDSAQYDGSYGNKTVETLADGTELWYCHQTSFVVSPGATVQGGQLIGYVGSTGHTTGPHLHVEVRPGGGDPVDPYTAMIVHGLQP